MRKPLLSLLCTLLLISLLASCGATPPPSTVPAPPVQSQPAVSSEPPPAPPVEPAEKDPELKTILILGTGGTIAGTGTAGKTTDYKAGELDVQTLIDGVPGLDKLANLAGEQVLNTASDNVTAADWLTLAKRINELSATDDVDGFVITHGTDTLEETAYFLHLTVKTHKPVVVVGAMRPATATSADGPMNLYQAVALARSDEAIGQGTMVVFSDGIYSARDVTKVNTFKTDAFGGRDIGCLGYMRDDTPYFYHQTIKPHTIDTPFDITDLTELPKVAIAYFHIDADPAVLEYMFKNYEGVVLAGAGNGSASTLWGDKAAELITSTGKPFVRSARIANGTVNTSYDAAISAGNPNPQKSRILLQLALTLTKDHAEIAEYFATY